MPKSSQYSLPATYYRGGTSKALFFREDVLPGPGPQRDRLLKRAMGSPDPLQLDGMGGSKAVTSKIAIVRPSTQSDADIAFTFAQVGVARDFIHYGANCGNISAAVGPFAIEEGLVQFRPGRSVDTTVKTQEVRIYNTGTGKLLSAHVPGTHEIAGVPGKGSPVLLDYRFTIGVELSRGLLPTGNASDMITVAKKEIEITICDIANLCVFANARDFNISGHETAADLTANLDWLAKTQELLGKAAVLAGAVVAPDPDPSKAHLAARLFLDKMCHESMAGTGAICTTACSRIPGSVVNRVIGDAMELDTLEISHAVGTMAVPSRLFEPSAASWMELYTYLIASGQMHLRNDQFPMFCHWVMASSSINFDMGGKSALT
ncbi:PrpF protein-domain-containing protein [Aspergillus welwitschiae]|uniref:PrpF protein-domain-containing protein n=1 Tax=Aspergillus welwitschiae TaxID=1341132 RepID=A0A3F3Q895_9EURO|nr:PrpF protein-domain-containing protein [Aspergillus welwitschiae]RDH35408.1 PrpF protein-domain-containing protein [Aspergillus welwitschiae]